ncbi:MAG: T9SS type A sorting domain-containing protein, partial [Chitinophagaceae bacterium]
TTYDDNANPDTSYATIYILISNQFPTPIILESFNVFEHDCKVSVNWVTTQELNVAYYDIERKDKNQDYQSIARWNVNGNSNEEKSHSYLDINPSEGENEYRLKIVDLDGKFTYTKSQTTFLSCNSNTISVYPNPTSSDAFVTLRTNGSELFTIKVYDMTGKVVYTNAIELENEATSIQIPTSNLASGIYNISVNSSEETKVFQLVKTSN